MVVFYSKMKCKLSNLKLNPVRPRQHIVHLNENGKEAVQLAQWAKAAKQSLLLISETSGGKTMLAKHLAKYVFTATDWDGKVLTHMVTEKDDAGESIEVERPVPQEFVQITCLPGLQAESLAGMWIPQAEGGLKWSDGPLTHGAMNGCLIALEEFTRLNQDLQARFFTILDEGSRSYPLPDKGAVNLPIHPNAMVIATANPVEIGYLTHELDRALEDRFVIRDFGHDHFVDEPKVLDGIFGGDTKFVEMMMNFAIDMRANSDTMVTPRQLIQSAKMIGVGAPAVYAIMRCIGEKFRDHKGIIETTAKAHFTGV
jgi:hypothetical protein